MTEIEYENCACGGRRPKGTAPIPECGALPPEPDFERKTGYTAGPLMELENELIGPDEMEKLHKALPWVRSLVYGLIKRIYQHRTARSTTGALTLELADELFGSFLRVKGGTYYCVHCERPIDEQSWVCATHEPDCIVEKARAYLSVHKPSAVTIVSASGALPK